MKQKTMETLGYIVNGLSIALFIYLVFTFDVPAFLHPLMYLGWVLLGCGIGLVVLSIVALVRNQGAGLVEHGVYGLVRHPMYVGAMLCFLSYSFFHPHWLVLLLSFINIAVIYWFIRQGDQQNITKFGDAYRRYMESVPQMDLLAGVFRRLQSR